MMRAAQAKKIPRDRTERLLECRRRLRKDWELERAMVVVPGAPEAAGGRLARGRGVPPGLADRHRGQPAQPARVEGDVGAAQQDRPRGLAGVFDDRLGRPRGGPDAALQSRGVGGEEGADALPSLAAAGLGAAVGAHRAGPGLRRRGLTLEVVRVRVHGRPAAPVAASRCHRACEGPTPEGLTAARDRRHTSVARNAHPHHAGEPGALKVHGATGRGPGSRGSRERRGCVRESPAPRPRDAFNGPQSPTRCRFSTMWARSLSVVLIRRRARGRLTGPPRCG